MMYYNDLFPKSSFDTCGEFSQKYVEQEKRYAYSTPKSFLEFIKLYSAKVGTSVSALFDNKERVFI